MTLHILTEEQERTLRLAYVRSPGYNMEDWAGYKHFAIDTIPGVLDATYKGDNPNYIGSLIFDNQKSLIWYLLRHS